MKQDEAAEKADISRTLLSKMETGDTPYTQRTLEALAAAYGTTPADLLSVHPVERISDKAAILAALRRLAIVPEGFEGNAYNLLTSAWSEAGAQSPQTPNPSLSQDANPHHDEGQEGKPVRQFSS